MSKITEAYSRFSDKVDNARDDVEKLGVKKMIKLYGKQITQSVLIEKGMLKDWLDWTKANDKEEYENTISILQEVQKRAKSKQEMQNIMMNT